MPTTGMWMTWVIVVSVGIRRRCLRESFCHVRMIKPDADIVYVVQTPHVLASAIQSCLDQFVLLALASSPSPNLSYVDIGLLASASHLSRFRLLRRLLELHDFKHDHDT
jgi:hypothetical protein